MAESAARFIPEQLQSRPSALTIERHLDHWNRSHPRRTLLGMDHPLMPAAFLGHGSPMNTLETNRFTDAWRRLGASVSKPRAILCISAHWYVNVTAVTAMPKPKTIHDFYGFPRELFEVEYGAPGSPEVAEEVAEIAKPTVVGLDHDSWGLDHGTWSVLVHAFPNADVPVVQLAINRQQDIDYHLELGAKLNALRSRGVLIVASGNVVHNPRLLDWDQPDEAFEWGQRFDDAARRQMLDRPEALGALKEHGDYRLAVPTPDHFLPLAYIAGVASASGHKPSVLIDGHAFGSISMTCFTVDGKPAPAPRSGKPSAGVPHDVPPEDTNT